MGSLTKQPSREFNPTPVHKRFSQGNNTHLRAEPSSQKSPGQGSRPKGRGSVGSNGPSPGHLDNRTDSETSHGDDYQHHQTSKDIWDILFRPGPGDTKEDVKPLLLKTQYPTLLSPTELQSLEQPSLRPNKPLPKIPT
ncbi:hypothetical protein BKA56DRAFT_619558 [Ilyonectria sp. MPI-CAGE-AT-0026]|nr:hypothetical protein BKA56DRAFT_619558 [Ilyonectria sp. MPI-CAGE-AT-0026]